MVETMGKIQNGILDLVIVRNRNAKYTQICTLNIVRLVIGQFFLNFSGMGISFFYHKTCFTDIYMVAISVNLKNIKLVGGYDYTNTPMIKANVFLELA